MLIASTLRRPRSRNFGASLIELMVGITIVAIGVAMAAPGFTMWIRNSQIKSAAESLQNGIRFAQTEAVRRNSTVRFQLTSSVDASCALSATGSFWVVNMGASVTPAGGCGTISDATTPYVLAVSPVVTSNSVVSMSGSTPAGAAVVLAFDGLGRQIATTNPSTTVAAFTVTLGSALDSCFDRINNPDGVRCLKVVVNPAGQVRMCDPGAPTSNTANLSVAC